MKFEYDTTDYIRKINKGNSYFDTFLNKESLAAGILILKPGEEDTQLPHDSDEMYYILEGDGFLKIKNKDYVLKKGKAFFFESVFSVSLGLTCTISCKIIGPVSTPSSTK